MPDRGLTKEIVSISVARNISRNGQVINSRLRRMSVFGCMEECIYAFVQRANTRIRQTSVTKVNRSQNKYVETDLIATASQDTERPPHDRFIFFIVNIANEIFFSHVLSTS